MQINFGNPWVDMMLRQVWIVGQVSEVAVKCVDPQLLSDPQSLSDYCLYPTEERLNPLEFHGKRRLPSPRRSPSSKSERRAMPHRLGQDKRAC